MHIHSLSVSKLVCVYVQQKVREKTDYVINMHINYVVVDHDAVVKMRMVDVVMMCCTE